MYEVAQKFLDCEFVPHRTAIIIKKQINELSASRLTTGIFSKQINVMFLLFELFELTAGKVHQQVTTLGPSLFLQVSWQ